MFKDTFYTKKNCDRCKGSLKIRTISWFTEETICANCSAEEKMISSKLRAQGKSDHEGCGYIPNV